ncbi:thioesterase domain-containing protein [Streptomyces sp. NL15-2K]|uniref:thioesterase domain-containing protein n=1 Tax=Streptomyces sp. NL15-2K TaxID=376149 RepID=UPI000F57A3F7|nr:MULTISPECIES: thioesterase domain-containing protein [Actinomycetes]WKX14785.1 thioesterase domain-containing protein [Kutzneria buriramensis]GCB44115.1 non-ribosomal peptide synthetase [Streptomyces sp. NL15-2K]
MRPPRDARPPVAQPFRTAAPGRRTVYLVHPGALPAQVHRGLADALPEGDGLTVLDLASVPEYAEAALTGGRAATTVEALADRLLTAMGPVTGPYTLAGWSFGGVLALAMSHKTPAVRCPERLVLLDSIAPTEEYQQPDDALEPDLLLGWFAMYLGAKRGRPIGLAPGRLAGRGVDDGLTVVLDTAVAAGALHPDTPLPGLRKLYDTYVDGLLRNNRLTAPHRPGPAPLPLVLVTAERSLIPDDPTLGWRPLAPQGLTLHRCPGDHYTMLSRPDSLGVIAPLLNAA